MRKYALWGYMWHHQVTAEEAQFKLAEAGPTGLARWLQVAGGPSLRDPGWCGSSSAAERREAVTRYAAQTMAQERVACNKRERATWVRRRSESEEPELKVVRDAIVLGEEPAQSEVTLGGRARVPRVVSLQSVFANDARSYSDLASFGQAEAMQPEVQEEELPTVQVVEEVCVDEKRQQSCMRVVSGLPVVWLRAAVGQGQRQYYDTELGEEETSTVAATLLRELGFPGVEVGGVYEVRATVLGRQTLLPVKAVEAMVPSVVVGTAAKQLWQERGVQWEVQERSQEPEQAELGPGE